MKRVDPRLAYRLLYPAGPAVVAAEHHGKISAMPVVSMISLSNSPPLVGFSASTSHDTYHTIEGARRFSVSWLDEKHREAVKKMGTTSGKDVQDKISACGLHH